MNNEEFQTVGLYEHNGASYKKVREAYNKENVVGIVHATGTGKTYIALQLAYDNKDKKIVYVVPSIGIIEHIKKIIEDNPNLNLKRDFANIEFRTYQSFISLDKEEIENIKCDMLILDEFHHIGAPIWGARINTVIETHPNIKIFGMTAYTVRDRGTSYERDMANPETNELFSNKIVSKYDLCDAMIDGLLPKPIYKSANTNLIGLESYLEEKVQKLNATSHEYHEYMAILSSVKKRIHEAPSIPNILRKNIKPKGKYIYFCPPYQEEGTNDIETIKKQAMEWFKQFIPEEDIIFYTSTSEMGKEGKVNREAFYNDVTIEGEKVKNKLRIMFAINQYNEGIHAPNVDGVIMGRGTTSDIVYYEQLGRALAVRGNTKEMFDKFEEYSFEQLITMCKNKDITVKEEDSKEDLIEKLVAPVVIDLTNNYEFIKELENNLRNRIKEIQVKGLGKHRKIKIKEASFDIEIEDQDLFEMLKYVQDRLAMRWEDYYELAKKYYEYHGNLLIPAAFKTINGVTYDENGKKLGLWLSRQRIDFSSLTSERQELLKQIGFVLNALEEKWQQMYELAKKYYEHYGNLLIPNAFKTINGITYDENGKNLGLWLSRQRKYFSSLTPERHQLLKQIGFVLNSREEKWQQMYELAKKYYEHYGNLLIPTAFKTINGITYDENGKNLGYWLNAQRRYFSSLTPERHQLLKQIGFVLNALEEKWQQMYELAKKYYEHYGNLLIPRAFKTINGVTYDEKGENLGLWLSNQRADFSSLTPERQQLLKQIGFVLNVLEEQWQQMYELAKKYYEYHGNLLIPTAFKTINGVTYDENGKNLGLWLSGQRRYFSSLTPERQQLLKQIGFVLNALEEKWQQMYELAKKYYEYHGNLLIPTAFKTINGVTYDENGKKLGLWLSGQRTDFSSLTPERQQLLKQIGFVLNAQEEKWQQMYGLAKKYYEHYGNLLIPQAFKTTNGVTYDEKGENLGYWLNSQRQMRVSNSEHGILLIQIGMVWNIKKNKEEIQNICIQYNIDEEINKIILNHISIQELIAKIEFLKSHNYPIVDEKGKLLDIFSMSSINMKEKYGVSLEELIYEYDIKNEKEKGA